MKYFIVICAICLIVLTCCQCRSEEAENEKDIGENSMMFSIEGVAYPTLFANYQRNSFVRVDVKPRWQLVWSKNYAAAKPDLNISPYSVQIKDNTVGISGVSEMLLYDTSGSFRQLEQASGAVPVVFGRLAMAFVKPSLILKYMNYQLETLRENGSLPGLKDYAHAVLFKPGKDDILSVVQYSGGPRRKPPVYTAARMLLDNDSFIWKYKEEGTIDHALLSNDETRMVLIQGDQVTVINNEDGKKSEPFQTQIKNPTIASLDLKDNLVILGANELPESVEYLLEVISLDGNDLWRIRLNDPALNQLPVCGGGGEVYVIDSRMLNCFKDGEIQWQYLLKSGAGTWVTVTQNNYIIVLNGNFLTILDGDGVKQYEDMFTKTDETFNAPVAVDGSGRLYVAGNKTLYCFETHE
jgi:hypothetical protein